MPMPEILKQFVLEEIMEVVQTIPLETFSVWIVNQTVDVPKPDLFALVDFFLSPQKQMEQRTAEPVDVPMPQMLKESGKVDRLTLPLHFVPPQEQSDAMERLRARLLFT